MISNVGDEFVDRMPYPIARVYREMLAEPSLRFRFRHLIKVFVSALKYLSLTDIADYMENPSSDAVNNVLSQFLRRPSLGHWLVFMTAIHEWRRVSGRSSRIRDASSILSGEIRSVIDHLIHLRNEYVHPDVFPSEEESRVLYESTLPHVHEVLHALEFLSTYPLIRISNDGEKEARAMGPDLAPSDGTSFRVVVRCEENAGHLFDVDITPFMLLVIDQSFADLLVYETLLGNRARFITGNQTRFVVLGDEPDNRVRLLLDLLRRVGSDEERERESEGVEARRDLGVALEDATIPMHTLRQLAVKHSNGVFEEYKAAGRYDPRTYVPRDSMHRAYESLLNGPANALVMIADSGVGKSTEMCRLSRQHLKSDIVWMVSGRRSPSGSPLDDILRSLFEKGKRDQEHLSTLLATFDRQRTTERFVILFDGINEAPNPLAVFREIEQLITDNPYRWLKVVVTCRTYAWKAILQGCTAADNRRFVRSPKGDIAHVLAPFNDDELLAALDRYATAFQAVVPSRWRDGRASPRERKLLRSPLLLRFVFEAFQGREDIPVSFDVETIMKEFTKERLRPRDLPFLERYLMGYFFREETDVLDATRLVDLRERDDIPGDYQQLLEHIFGEQVYEVDQVWRCPDVRCVHGRMAVLVTPGVDEPRCPLGDSFLYLETVDNRSTYSRLLSENILTQSDGSGRVLVRLVFDRYFDYLMRQYCFTELMAERYDERRIDELFAKATRHSVFVEPLVGVLQMFWELGEVAAVDRIAAGDTFASYHVLRELFVALSEADFPSFATKLRSAVVRTDFNANICRAGIHALLIDADIAGRNREETVELLLLLSQCAAEQVHEEIGHYLFALHHHGVDLITPVIERCSATMLSAIGVGRGIRTLVMRGRRNAVRGAAVLFLNVALFGLGSSFEDLQVRTAVTRNGLTVIQRALRHPLLSWLGAFLARFVARWFARLYRDKGPLPCNYWEMELQLDSDREAIRRASDLFFIDRGNVFDLPYEDFYRTVHAENGLVSWFILSVLPAHFRAAADPARAIEYLLRLVREGSESDCYVVGQAVTILVRSGHTHVEKLMGVLDAAAARYLNNPSELFLHLKPAPAGRSAARAAAHTRRVAEQERTRSNPYMVPWIEVRDGEVHRVYHNAVVLYVALMRMERNPRATFKLIADLLEKNHQADLLRFGDDVQAGRRYIAHFLIQAVAVAAENGYLQAAFECLHYLIPAFVGHPRDPENLEVYRYSIVQALKAMKEYHEEEVMAFVDRFNTSRAEYAFLIEVRTAATEKEKLFSRSLFGGNIYHSAFSSRVLREAFGEFTRAAASARDADDLFYIYTRSFMQWLKNYEPRPAVASVTPSVSAIGNGVGGN